MILNKLFKNHIKLGTGLSKVFVSTISAESRLKSNERILHGLIFDIHTQLEKGATIELADLSKYYFDGVGKGIRPLITMNMAECVNEHLGIDDYSKSVDRQRQIAMIAEMYHTASLLHDDVIDGADRRRNKISVNKKWNQRKSILGGDYVVAVSNMILGQLKDPEVVHIMSQVLSDLILGEFQQMKSGNKSDRFQRYLNKTFNKTASLMAHACKAVTVLAKSQMANQVDEDKFIKNLPDAAFNYGKNIGIAFQLIDDYLDFAATAESLGKPAAADLKLGLATAPVLFASEQYPELEDLINRRFSMKGDVDKAFNLVLKSNGMSETHFLARKYCDAAVESIRPMKNSEYKTNLINLADQVLNRGS